MGCYRVRWIRVASAVGPALWCTMGWAQQDVPAPDQAPATTTVPSAPAGGSTTIVVQPPTTTTTSQSIQTPWGVPAPGFDPDEGLSSSSRASGQDTFDLSGAGNTSTAYGGKDSEFTLRKPESTVVVPEYHLVRRGDTLWDLCNRYYENPYAWPRVWAYNPQVENPHWIYPGDRLRVRPGTPGRADHLASETIDGQTLVSRRGLVPAGTVFLRDRGYLGDPRSEVWGRLVGSPDDQMLLSEGNEIYMEISGNRDIRIGQELTVFRPDREPEEGDAEGYIVSVLGTARVERWDPKTKVATARLIESLDVIERGAMVGPIGRRFDVVPPVPNDREVRATIIAAIEPREIIGQNQVVFIDKGRSHGLRPGNRLFVTAKGDRWRQSIQYGRKMAAHRMRYELHKAEVETGKDTGTRKDLPTEVIGEIRVLRTRETTSACLVSFSSLELQPGDPAIARRGY